MEPSVSLRPPFDYADADIISCACDGINFHLYKNIVAKASTVFGDMFSLPTDPDAQPEIPQTVPLTEDADTLERLFRLCLPVVPSQFHPSSTISPPEHCLQSACTANSASRKP
ncbi:uncharacterized protein TRAVEDRAFT_43549 [Trametes versicolor FP-101664 SS1]|uniref:uncharacterized protein n=1 Tax=Trametes versicolor (strain FP-101664) TaxID=717944 RepID=UPI00046232DE|nr:uncharacterized protein TRAVEDRAFT_43549 [Trametes versicolor FP-101664 SS1]EIW63245.1 hypothetical protein TRAVEDRAFT_43549 [Trametes versicolor FP-101664 SS1]